MNEGFPKNDPEKGKMRRKTPEEIQAQIAAFAAEKLDNNGDRKYIFNYVVPLSGGASEDVQRVTDDREYEVDKETGKGILPPAGVERTISSKQYADFLRSAGGSNSEAIKGRAEMLGAYRDFAPAIRELKESIKDLNREEHSAFLGSGMNSSVFLVENAGKKYAVRIPGKGEISPSAIDKHLAAAVLAKGIPHLEQIVAASYEDGVTIAELMPGKEVGKLTAEEIRSISNGQLAELIDTLLAASHRGIEIDPKPSNFFYDQEVGFGIVDIGSSKVIKNSADQNIETVVGWVATPLGNAGVYGKPFTEKLTPEDYASDLEFSRAHLDVLTRYRAMVGEKMEDKNRETAQAVIDKDIRGVQESISNYSNPEWIKERIKSAKENEGKRAKVTHLFGWGGVDV
jgi:hypothetical protein